jgi:GNAT superfamily N-acetyltransferase
MGCRWFAVLNFEVVPAHDLSLAEQAKIFTEAFAGYIAGSFQMDASSLAAFMCGNGVDICYSRFAKSDAGLLASFGCINRTGNITRLAAMGTVPAARRTGAAMFLVSHLLDEAKARGDEAMVLEVIEQNPPAVALYRSCGFNALGRLFGWRSRPDHVDGDRDVVREIPIDEALRLPAIPDYPGLPWQISRYAAAKVASARAFAGRDVAVIIGETNPSSIRIHGYLGFEGDNWEQLRSLTIGLLAKFPQAEFLAPPIFPESFGVHIFEPLKFRKEPLSQFLMRKDL